MGWRDTIAKKLAGIKAYHSSPHDFDKFDLKKIGTGEGAQVYGHGLYFAENPAVSGQGGQYWNQFLSRFPGPEGDAAHWLRETGFDRDAAIAKARLELERASKWSDNVARRRQQGLDELLKEGPVGPRTYEVNIKADPAQMLNWDKSMSAQPEVMNKIRPLFSDYRLAPSNYLGESVHKEIRDFHMGQGMSKPAAAEATAIDLRSSGIPGIKYLDEGSRTIQPAITDIERAIKQGGMYKGAGPDMWASRLDELKATPLTSNYVVFDPGVVDIMKKYGVVGAPAGALAMGALADQSQYEVQP